MTRPILTCALLVATALTVPPTTVRAATLSDAVRGRTLLAVERRGETWYADPVEGRRYPLRSDADAFSLIRAVGLGITDRDLAAIPTDTDGSTGDLGLRARLAGRILIAVQSRGEAWYVHPVDRKRRLLGSPTRALQTLQRLSLGILDRNLLSIPLAPGATDASASTGLTLQDVPSTSQAPFGEWSDPRQQEGCEEASALMADAWTRGSTLTTEGSREAILAMSDWERTRYGSFVDTSAQDTNDRLLVGYLGIAGSSVRAGIGTDDIRREIEAGHVVIVPVNGKIFRNPSYSNGGPLRHMVLVIGHDRRTDEFIVHDPGTRNGASMRHTSADLASSLQDYTTGTHDPIGAYRTAMISVIK
ncbi:C39 family peptidase [Patescibacteria group bacterium]|nr:C39 family peptidase [Patescibacteria group bacterium]MBU1448577.1 C39 family peptidase [Patescibacteria group bacterium]MBU2613022.1 C39 family peptidase [Patescibacteria group bacterium]